MILLYAWARHLEFHDLIEQVLDTCMVSNRQAHGPRFPVDTLLIENTAAGKPAASELQRMFGTAAPFMVELVDVSKTSKVSRVYSIEHLFSSGMVYAPDKSFADLVTNQVSMFPVGKRDDLVDSTSMALRYLRDNSWVLTPVEVHEDERALAVPRRRLLPLYPA
jgi:phage terminase large subunit-like protein